MSFARIVRLVLATSAVTAVVTGIGTVVHANHINGWAHWAANVPNTPNYAGVGTDKKYIGACDMQRDGNGVYAEFLVDGYVGLWLVDDPNGSQAGCGVRTPRRNITRFRVCEDDLGLDSCSKWVLVDD